MFRKPFPCMHFSPTGTPQAKDRARRGDVYRYIASGMFGVPEENITPAMRKAAKDKMIRMVYS